MKEGKKQKKKMKHTVCLMSYLKIKTQSYVCTDVWQLMRLLTTYTLSDQQGKILRDYLLSINHLPVRNAYSSLNERLTNGSESSLFYSSLTNSLAIH